MKNTKSASLDALRAMHDHGETTVTSESAETTDLPEGFWDTAIVEEPRTKKAVSLRVDPDILEYFKGQGNGHLTKMHAGLRSYVDAQRKLATPTPK